MDALSALIVVVAGVATMLLPQLRRQRLSRAAERDALRYLQAALIEARGYSRLSRSRRA